MEVLRRPVSGSLAVYEVSYRQGPICGMSPVLSRQEAAVDNFQKNVLDGQGERRSALSGLKQVISGLGRTHVAVLGFAWIIHLVWLMPHRLGDTPRRLIDRDGCSKQTAKLFQVCVEFWGPSEKRHDSTGGRIG